MQNFATRFRQLRNERGLTQENLIIDFNDKYGYQYAASTASKYENGKRMPELTALQDFARYFNVSVSYLLGEVNVRGVDTVREDDNYIFIVGKNGVRRKYPVPTEKLERFRLLLEAGLPEILSGDDEK
jgi:transcriptional regulator with XRE-family HTH domain